MKKIAVIGAGPGGLAAAKELQEKGMEVVVFEKGNCMGGVFGSYAKKDTMWRHANLTSSKWITEFSDYPMPDHYPHFPTIQMMAEYLERYADTFGIRSKIRFAEQVLRIERREQEGTCLVVTDKNSYEFAGVVVGTGLHHIPYIPDIQGKDDFQGRIFHSTQVHNAEEFRNRRVLVVGLGESGVFICSQVIPVAAKTVISLRNGVNFVPRAIAGVPLDCSYIWQLGKHIPGYIHYITIGSSLARFIPKFLRRKAGVENFLSTISPCWNGHGIEPWHRYDDIQNSYAVKVWWSKKEFVANYNDCLEQLAQDGRCTPVGAIDYISQHHVHLADGTTHSVDDIIFSTGFTHDLNIKLPFVHDHHSLFKGIFHPAAPNIALVGFIRPNIGSMPGMLEIQARYIAQIMSGEKSLPKNMSAIIQRENAKNKREYPESHNRLPHLREFREFMDDMAKLVGCEVKFHKLCTDFEGLIAFFSGPHIPQRYRLCGEGASPQTWERYIKTCWELRTSRIHKVGFLTMLFMFILSVMVFCIPAIWIFLGKNYAYSYFLILLGPIIFVYSYLQFRPYLILKITNKVRKAGA